MTTLSSGSLHPVSPQDAAGMWRPNSFHHPAAVSVATYLDRLADARAFNEASWSAGITTVHKANLADRAARNVRVDCPTGGGSAAANAWGTLIGQLVDGQAAQVAGQVTSAAAAAVNAADPNGYNLIKTMITIAA